MSSTALSQGIYTMCYLRACRLVEEMATSEPSEIEIPARLQPQPPFDHSHGVWSQRSRIY